MARHVAQRALPFVVGPMKRRVLLLNDTDGEAYINEFKGLECNDKLMRHLTTEWAEVRNKRSFFNRMPVVNLQLCMTIENYRRTPNLLSHVTNYCTRF